MFMMLIDLWTNIGDEEFISSQVGEFHVRSISASTTHHTDYSHSLLERSGFQRTLHEQLYWAYSNWMHGAIQQAKLWFLDEDFSPQKPKCLSSIKRLFNYDWRISKTAFVNLSRNGLQQWTNGSSISRHKIELKSTMEIRNFRRKLHPYWLENPPAVGTRSSRDLLKYGWDWNKEWHACGESTCYHLGKRI